MKKIVLTLLLSIVSCLCEALPAQVILIRHGEKPKEGAHLSLRGQERAAALIPFFMGNPQMLEFGTPVAIYAMSPTKSPEDNTSMRAIETVQGLADALHLQLKKHHRSEYHAMAEEILNCPDYEGKMVLICWEHTVIPKLAEALNAEGFPKNWPSAIFDRCWMITYGPSEKDTPPFQNLPQRLLQGDSVK
jgi:hypothetical protein